MSHNFKRTAEWLRACGKAPGDEQALSTQIGVVIEEVAELIGALSANTLVGHERLLDVRVALHNLSRMLLDKTDTRAIILPQSRTAVLDALCDIEVTINGVAYLAGMDKPGADAAVLASNDAKLVNGKPVIQPGGKIGKPEGWVAPDLTPFARHITPNGAEAA